MAIGNADNSDNSIFFIAVYLANSYDVIDPPFIIEVV